MRRLGIRHLTAAVAAALVLAAAGAQSAAAGQTRAAALSPTTTTVTTTKASAVYGDSVTFRANVFVANSTIPASGAVTFAVDGVTLAAGVAISGGVAAVTTSALSGGSHAITASYPGAGVSFSPSNGSLTQVVAKANPTVTLGSSANPSTFGNYVTVTATVTGIGPSQPSGSVSFPSSGLPAVTLAAGQGTFQYNRGSAGSTTFQGLYSGDANYNAASATALTQVVNPAPTTVTLVSSQNPSWYYQTGPSVTVTVAAVGGPSVGVPTGKVTTTPGNGYVNLDASGKATFLLRDYTPGVTTLVGTYSGDANFAPSTSAPLIQTITKSSQPLTIAGVPATPVVYGSPLAFMFSVKSPAGARVPTGTLTLNPFDADGNATKTLSGTATATFATTAGANASGSYVVTYSGDAYYAGGTFRAITVAVTKVSSTVAVSASASSATVGDTVTLTATVTGPGTDGGSVLFTDGGQSLGPPVTVTGGRAGRSVTLAGPGKHTFRAVFSGTANAGGSEATVDVAVAPAAASPTPAAAPTPAADKGVADAGKRAAAPGPATTTGAGSAAGPGAKVTAGTAKPAARPTAKPTAAAAGKPARPKAAKPTKPAAPKAKQKPTGK